MSRGCLLLLSAFLIVASPDPSLAEPAQLIAEGKRHERAKAWEKARAAYEDALQERDTPGLRLRLATVYGKLGDLLSEESHLQHALASDKLPKFRRPYVERRLRKVEKRLARITLKLPKQVRIQLLVDEKETGIETPDASPTRAVVRVNPGERTLRVLVEGYLPFEETVTLDEGQEREVFVALRTKPRPASSAESSDERIADESSGNLHKTLGYVSLGVGAVGLVMGSVMGVAAKSTRDELDQACPKQQCAEEQRDLYDKGKFQANLSTGGFIVGGVGVAVGALLLVTAPSSQESAHVQPLVGFGSVGVMGSF